MKKTPKNKAYWQKRAKAAEERNHNEGLKSFEYISEQYDIAAKELDEKIAVWYSRLAKNNDMTLAEAKKLLSAKELKEFRWTVEEYIKYGKENALNGQWMKELENASARVHIERFEALKLSMKATIEKLYGKQLNELNKVMVEAYSDTYYHSCFEIQKGFGIGWNVSKVDEKKLKKVLSTPWAADGTNFSERLWNNREKLISEVQNIVTRGIMTGKSPDKMTAELYKTMGGSKRNAGRVIMTETAAASAMADEEAYKELNVEEFEIVETFDSSTCDVCRELDGKHFPMSEYKVGVTVPPFHPWCRGSTAPYFEDMKGHSTRIARDVKTGETYYVPNDMTFEEWKRTQDEKYGEGTVDSVRKMNYNESADKKQFEKYKDTLGKEAPKKFDDFQKIKYSEPEKYAEIKEHYSYNQRVPEATKEDFEAYKAIKATGVTGNVRVPAKEIDYTRLDFNDNHAKNHGCTVEEAKSYVQNAKCSISRKRWDGISENYYSFDGAAYVDIDNLKIKTAFSKDDFDSQTKEILEVFK